MFKSSAVIDKVREIAAERPDFRYNEPGSDGQCYYRNRPDVPEDGCIIGVALDKLDSSWFEYELNENGVVILLGDVIDTDDKDGAWLEEVQAQQDGGMCWADAVAKADALIESWPS